MASRLSLNFRPLLKTTITESNYAESTQVSINTFSESKKVLRAMMLTSKHTKVNQLGVTYLYCMNPATFSLIYQPDQPQGFR